MHNLHEVTKPVHILLFIKPSLCDYQSHLDSFHNGRDNGLSIWNSHIAVCQTIYCLTMMKIFSIYGITQKSPDFRTFE